MVHAGDVCLFRGDIWHGAGMNSCETERRYMMQVHYGNQAIGKEYPAMRYAALMEPGSDRPGNAESQKQLLGGQE